MYVESFKNNGIPYLRLVRSDRVTNKKGIKTATKTVVLNIGPLSRHHDGQPNYVDCLKKSFKAGNPLIPILLPYCDKQQPAETYPTQMTEGNLDCFGHPRLFSHILLERIPEELGLNTFFSSYKGFTKLQYDVYGFTKLLTFGRLLNPASKAACKKGIESVAKNAPVAAVEDQTVEGYATEKHPKFEIYTDKVANTVSV